MKERKKERKERNKRLYEGEKEKKYDERKK